MRNYQSLVAIATALSSAPVQSLDLTRRTLDKGTASELEGLVKLCSADNNYSHYRKALGDVIDPTYRDYCVPWIGKSSHCHIALTRFELITLDAILSGFNFSLFQLYM